MAVDIGQLYKIRDVLQVIKPKRRRTAYVFFSQPKMGALRQEHPGLLFAEYSKLTSKAWNDLPKSEKAEFEKKAKADKERYQTEMSMFKAPEKPKNAFVFFAKVHENFRDIHKRWAALDAKEREEYKEMAQKDKEEYGPKLEQYKLNAAQWVRDKIKIPAVKELVVRILTGYILEKRREEESEGDEEDGEREKDRDIDPYNFDGEEEPVTEKLYEIPEVWDKIKPSAETQSKMNHKQLVEYAKEQIAAKQLDVLEILTPIALSFVE